MAPRGEKADRRRWGGSRRSVGAVSNAPTLGSRFADELPEMAVPWQAAEPPAPRLLVLNEPLDAELGLDAQWLRSDDSVRFLTGMT